MEIETLKRNNLKRNIIVGIGIVLVLATVILTFTRAKYRTTQSIPLVNGTINYSLADLNIVAITVDGEASDTIPEGNYELTENSYCTVNGEEDSSISISYEADKQLLTVTPFTTKGTKCYLDFVKKSSATETIEELYSNNQNMLAYDDYGNLRYIGANPNNYVLFNDELWRIIGIFSEDTHGVSGEKLIKIIRSDLLERAAWDSANINDWSTASLQTTLNSDYLNGTGSYASTGIKNDTARNMIETVTWKLGGSNTYNDVTANMFYERERGTTVYNGRPTTWRGKVALIYPSDYGYATNGGSITNRDVCLAKELYNWNTSGFSDCMNNDWLFNSATQWTLTTISSFPDYVFLMNSSGAITYIYDTVIQSRFRPTLYLKSSVSITGGTGTFTDPFTLKM